MRRSRALILAAVCMVAGVLLGQGFGLLLAPFQRYMQRSSDDIQIRNLLAKQAEDWNRGDLDAFAHGYKDSPDILFIGKKVHRGYAEMLAGYKAAYPTPETRGTLSFSQLEVQLLSHQFATATGHFHLERTTSGGGNADGYFLLVLENTTEGWKIVRDDTTAAS